MMYFTFTEYKCSYLNICSGNGECKEIDGDSWCLCKPGWSTKQDCSGIFVSSQNLSDLDILNWIRVSYKFQHKKIWFSISEFVCKYDSHCKNKGRCNLATGKCKCEYSWLSDDCTPTCKCFFEMKEELYYKCLLFSFRKTKALSIKLLMMI